MTVPPHDPDRLEALRRAAAAEGDELAALDVVIRRLRAADAAVEVPIDPEASWRRIVAFLDAS
jgi:hypothetical protein